MTLRFELLEPAFHDRAAFRCGEPSLDEFLARYTSQNHRSGLATTHALVDDEQRTKILGYASVAMAEVRLESLQPSDQKRLPRYPLPALRIARLAVDSTAQGQGHGEALLGFVTDRARTLRATEVGVCLVVVDALHERAAAFYSQYGFRATTFDALTLYLPLGR